MDTMRRAPQPPERRPVAPVQEPATVSAAPETPRYEPKSSSRRPKNDKTMKNKLLLALAGLAVVVIVLVGGYYAYRAVSPSLIDRGKYQAVFLSNGQVYFGKLHLDNNYYVLKDIFYLQASDAQNSANPDSKNPQQSTSSDVKLIKLGTEVHGPTDQMVIDKGQVLFFENLKDDGSVVKSIKSYTNPNK
ncbi:MAG TPA: hypothetical protein VL362_00810 [Patescibacteria group bacterium]|nr:hypothetical protein [Patescibacteria group bacterium]